MMNIEDLSHVNAVGAIDESSNSDGKDVSGITDHYEVGADNSRLKLFVLDK